MKDFLHLTGTKTRETSIQSSVGFPFPQLTPEINNQI